MISQTVDYALRAMSHLARLNGRPATCAVIARGTRVSRSYLQKIMRDLVQAGLLRSFRGPHGGFVLTRDPQRISVLDIVNAVDPIRRFRGCPLDDHPDACALHRCLDHAIDSLQESFERATLAAVAQPPFATPLTVHGAARPTHRTSRVSRNRAHGKAGSS